MSGLVKILKLRIIICVVSHHSFEGVVILKS